MNSGEAWTPTLGKHELWGDMNSGAMQCTSQDDGPPKVLKGITALHHIVEQIKVKAESKENITLSDLDPVMAYKPLMTDAHRLLIGSLAKSCISELGRAAVDGAASSSSKKDATKQQKTLSSVMSFFG